MARIDRLETLKQFFIKNKETIERHNLFDITSWSRLDDELIAERHGFENYTDIAVERHKIINDLHSDNLVTPHHICGTTACVLGWAGYIPEFRAEGLTTKIGTVVYRTSDSLESGMDFFDISRVWACFLFLLDYYPDSEYVSIDDVIRQIDLVIDYYKNHAEESEYAYRESLCRSTGEA